MEEVVMMPAQLIRITAVTRRVLEEMRAGPLDNAARVRVTFLMRECLAELEQCLGSSLHSELRQLIRSDMPNVTDKSLHVAMATLLGWLEGLIDGIQMALTAQRVTAFKNARGDDGQAEKASPFNRLRRAASSPGVAQHAGQYL